MKTVRTPEVEAKVEQYKARKKRQNVNNEQVKEVEIARKKTEESASVMVSRSVDENHDAVKQRVVFLLYSIPDNIIS